MGPDSKPWAIRKPWEAAVPVARANRQWANRRRASESLDDAPQDPRLPSYPPDGPSDRLPDLYGSLSRTFGISIWPNAAFEEGVGINALTGADPCSPVGGAAFHDTAIWIRPA